MSNIDLSLLPDFIVEAEEHLEEMEALLLRLMQQTDDLEVLNDIFRPIHTIKGGAQYIGLEKISQLAHRLEDLLDQLRDGSRASNDEIVETLITATDRIKLLVAELEANQSEDSPVDDLLESISVWTEGRAGAEVPVATQVRAAPGVTEEEALPISVSAYGAEEDKELYDIFEGHLQEHFSEMVSVLNQITAGGETSTLLEQSLNVLEQMRSSANYMDYVDLVQRYQIWKNDLQNALMQANAGEVIQIDSLFANMQELAELFPVLKDVVLTVTGTVTPSQAEEKIDVSEEVAREFAERESTEEPAVFTEDEAAGDIELSLLPDFVIETDEHLDEMEALLLQLMQQPDNRNVLNDIFRPIHSIKGSAQYIGLAKVSRLSHVLEDLLDLLREGKLESSFEIVELLIAARDRILQLNIELKASQQEKSEVDDLVEFLAGLLPGATPAPEEAAAEVVMEMPLPTVETRGRSPLSSVPYQEDEDKELFNIFIAYLQEQYEEIVNLLQDVAGGVDQVAILDACSAVVDKMTSSANYMDYLDLVQRYKIWQNEINRARNDLQGGTETSLAFIQHNIDELAALFPQLQNTGAAVAEEEEPSIKVVVNEPVVGGLEDTLAKKSSTDRTAAAQSVAAFDEQLFKTLAGALENSMPGGTRDEYETLNQIFDELVCGDEEKKEVVATAAAASPVKSMVTKEKTAGATEAKKRESAESKIRKSVRVDADKIDTLMNQVGELVVDRSYFFQLMTEMRNLQRHLKDTLGLEQKEVKMLRTFTYRLGEAIASLGRTSNDLQEGVMKMRMLPISQIFNRYPRLVHDLTRNSDKKVNLVVKGEDTELDRMIVEELSDPLIHIIRNAVDHGLESGAERQAKGKDSEATLVLEAYQESNHIVIEVTDDGKGIDPEKIRQKAIEKGLYTAEEMARFSRNEIIALIMTAGFSTADKITGTSGRGVGMDVVKKNIEKLNGTLEIDSKVGVGTQMRLKIPLTLAIIHALMVRVRDDLYTIPLANVDETVRIFKDETSTVEGVEVIHLRGETLPIFRLSTLFGQQRADDRDKSFVVIVSVGGTRTGFVVDELLGQEEVVIKPLADYVQDKSGFSGATIIGDGRISLILDVYEMVRMTANKQAKRQKEQTELLKSKIRRKGLAPTPNMVEGVAE